MYKSKKEVGKKKELEIRKEGFKLEIKRKKKGNKRLVAKVKVI